ncbi:TonB-dependent receptor [Pedobacter caeni]|uniref:TonB-dependent receptor n=1 Tax=Pedobacter caeni TaxID=288992 RepID=A0A1M5EQT6_9SPHI|nr:TonB-dependent receptor [Pedobacter caeni]SHF81579.1 TonB-dependent receptor [Pedobacter caeni]
MKSQLNLKKALITVLFVIIGVTVFAQTGKISGKVSDKKTGETLIGVTVKIKGSTIGVATNVKGEYSIGGMTAGNYSIQFSYMGYVTKEMNDVKVSEGNATLLNVDLSEEAGKALDNVSITAKVNRESETSLNMERKNSSVVLQKIGAQELIRKGLSNVAEGVTKIAGVSIVGNKNVFVRGLGDRYNNTMLNGLPIPSTNPDLKLIPLDIFPTSVVKNIGVTKSYSPELYGDFSGGNIDIITKDYPEKAFLKVGLSSGYNSITTGKDFYSTKRSFLNFVGFDRSDRAMPEGVANTKVYNSANQNGKPSDFSTAWSPEKKSAPVSTGFSVGGGNSYNLGDDRQFGFLANLTYKNDYRYSDGISAIFNAQQAPDYLYNTNRYSFGTNTSGLVNLFYKAGAKSSYSLTALYVNDSSNDIFDQQGFKSDLSGDIYARRNSYVQNSLLTTQLAGTNQLGESTKLKFALGYSNITGSTPDRVQNSFIDNKNGTYSFLKFNTSDNHRFFADLDENDFSGNVSVDFASKSENSVFRNLQVGIQGRHKKRVFGARQIDTKIGLSPVLGLSEVDQYLNDGRLGSGEDANSFRYQESYYAPNDYKADLNIAASFFNFNFEWNKKLKLIAGVRAEYSVQNTYFKESSQAYDAPFQKKKLDNIDILPAVTLKYLITEKSNVLFAASKTMSRPQFVEAAPFRYNVGFGIAEGEGNPDLVNSSNYNADLKYEIYPSANELFSVSVFGKYIDKPIELSQVNSADPLFTYINTDNALVAGIELEYNRNIASMFSSSSKLLKNMTLGINGSYIHSKIEISDETIKNSKKPIAPTNRSRPLFGASPYLINLDYSYKHNWSESTNTMFTVTYNVFGKRLFVAGAQQAGDIYEMPVNTLDFIVNTKINNRIGLDLNIGNILNPKVKFQQEYSNNNLIYNEYRKGINVGLNLNYSF